MVYHFLLVADQESTLRGGLVVKLRSGNGRILPLPANFGERLGITGIKLPAGLLTGFGDVPHRVQTYVELLWWKTV